MRQSVDGVGGGAIRFRTVFGRERHSQLEEEQIMANSHRQFFKQASGRVAHNINLDGFNITRRSVILVTAAPCSLGAGIFDPDIRLNVHGPDVRVTNIVPHGPEGGPGGVEFVLNVDSPTPVDVAVTITVFEPWTSFAVA
jgi:hypothetical protein